MKSGPSRKANIYTARVIPVLLFALIIYSSWIFTKLINVDYLLDAHHRQAQAVVLLILYYLLLLPVLVCYVRLFSTIIINPGFVPRGPQWHIQKAEKVKSGKSGRRSRKSDHSKPLDEKNTTNSWQADGDFMANMPEENFWRRSVFISNYDGRPPFCSHCLNYKLDRVHHCSEVNRCVSKMDHFCPWVGGIVSETSFKFFIQLNFYAALYTLFAFVVSVYYLVERRRLDSGFLNVHWVILPAVSGLFLLFGAGMFASSLQLAWINTTTVENLSRRTKIHYLAVYLPRPEESIRQCEAAGNFNLRTITYPRPPEEQFMILQQHGADMSSRSTIKESPPIPVTAPPIGTMGAPNSRTFAILEAKPGMNPWNLGSALENIREVLGTRIIDWFVPIRLSPCTNHDSEVSMYRLNPELEYLKHAAGLGDKEDPLRRVASTRSDRKRRRRKSHSQPNQPSDNEVREGQTRHERRHSSRRGKRGTT